VSSSFICTHARSSLLHLHLHLHLMLHWWPSTWLMPVLIARLSMARGILLLNAGLAVPAHTRF
jgi:hypothetical protein